MPDAALHAAVIRLLAAIDFTPPPHADVRVRDLWGAARALADLAALCVSPEERVTLRVLVRGKFYPNPAPGGELVFADAGDIIFPLAANAPALIDAGLCEAYNVP